MAPFARHLFRPGLLAPALVLATIVLAVPLSGEGTRSAEPSASPASSPAVDPSPASAADRIAPGTFSSGRRPSAVRPRVSAATMAALQARLDGLRIKYAVPGLSAAIIFPDGSRWVGSSGLADVASGRAVTPDTAFAVASVSKTFTGALIMALVQDGKMALDASARTYIPDLPIDRAITIRQLLDHTSGLRDFFFHPRIDHVLLQQRGRRWVASEALAYSGKPYFPPGRGWHYSNTNYLVLGMLAERVGGGPLSAQLRDRFFDPLGLAHSTYQPEEQPAGPMAHGYRFETGGAGTPVDLSDGSPVVPFTSVVTAAGGAGGIAASAEDIARWAKALYGGAVLHEATLEAMIADEATTRRYRTTVPYGLGIQLVPVDGRPSLGHSGRLLGFRSVMRYLPVPGISIAVLTNQSRTDPAIVSRALMIIALAALDDCPCPEPR